VSFSRDFVCKKFSEFYRNPSTVIPAPTATSQREFAFLLFREHAMIRHRSVGKISSLRSLFSENVPSDVYHSCAYYENPEADMDKKGWLGADLVFDIDADHIPTSCDKIHDEWTCGKCGFSGKGITPETCPACGGPKFDAKTWPCERCIDSARDETIKLVDILEKDFGFSGKDFHVFFSGHRGYHVHIEDEVVKSLDAMARKEIVDYVLGTGLLGFEERAGEKRKKGSERPFSLHDFGWNKRIKLGMQKFILNATRDDLRSVGLKQNVEAILQSREKIAKRYIAENRWTNIKGVGTETWLKIARHVKDIESAKIDTVVTTDIHRLIRMNGTLHGKTGLKKIELAVSRLQDFDPFKEAVAFKEGTVKVFVSNAPEFRLGGSVFGPYQNQTVELPTAAAVLLICKGRAEVAS
jgi:DNA primase small subunit